MTTVVTAAAPVAAAATPAAAPAPAAAESGPSPKAVLQGEAGTVWTISFLGDDRPLWLEVGFGGGEHMVAMAARYPQIGIIGCEPFINGVAMLLGKIRAAGVSNVSVHPGDARDLMDVLPDASVARAFLNYPDPWPKARHHKRRIIQSGTLNLFASRLKKGGVLHVATDHAGYAEWIDELVEVEPSLDYKGWPWPECPQLVDRQVITKFEGKGLDKEHVITEYLWEKK